ncbi:MAG: corrinoid protein [Desulfitobacteriaceae bacterium]|nr:corrinoid protein [Desulfitobacteriaceae bacterium]
MSQEDMLKKISETVIVGETEQTIDLVKQALDKGIDAFGIVENGLTKGMDVVGEKFENQEYFLPDLLIAATTVKSVMEILKPHLASNEAGKSALIVIGTVEGDIHDIGKNLVINSLEASGFRVIDLGVNVSAAKFVESVKQYQPDIVACSALISATMVNIEGVIGALQENGVRDQVKVMVGGAPLDQKFAESVGADYYGKTLRDAVVIANAVVEEGK